LECVYFAPHSWTKWAKCTNLNPVPMFVKLLHSCKSIFYYIFLFSNARNLSFKWFCRISRCKLQFIMLSWNKAPCRISSNWGIQDCRIAKDIACFRSFLLWKL
jgi:hypothetical protein